MACPFNPKESWHAPRWNSASYLKLMLDVVLFPELFSPRTSL
ncbi:hypothetical protein SAMN04515617_10697 [Collimonas sp. OK242]|jgi:hypothetical protein|nr:hypothetical protein SAMN04515617_10697 [Collimonas sp. OK242]